MLYVTPRTLYLSRRGGHHVNGMTTQNLTMPEGIHCCTDKYGVSCQQHTDAITNLHALHASATAKVDSEIIDKIGLHTEQCKPAAAWRVINRLTGRKFMPLTALVQQVLPTVSDN